MAASLIGQADLEARFPPMHVARVFADDGSSVAGPRILTSMDVASRQAEAILMRAWPLTAIANLVANDVALKDAICDLAMAHGVKGKPEWSGDGAPYAKLRDNARQTLMDVVLANQRSSGEPVAGSNPVVRAQVSVPDPHMVFTPTKTNPYVGGF